MLPLSILVDAMHPAYPLLKVRIQEFWNVVTLQVLAHTEHKLSGEEKESIKMLLGERKTDEALHFVKTKYSADEWNTFESEHLFPLIRSYRGEVLSCSTNLR